MLSKIDHFKLKHKTLSRHELKCGNETRKQRDVREKRVRVNDRRSEEKMGVNLGKL